MQTLFIAFVCICLLSSCNSRGHVPHYILTDSPESKEEVYKHSQLDSEKPISELKKDL